tara:strand:- start:57 stop:752 length:696 start_codon:yes stop_codon:yes gene_type:complete
MKMRKNNMNVNLKKDLVDITNNHWDTWLKAKKKNSIKNNDFSFVDIGMDKEFLFHSRVGRSYDSSLGTLWEKILFRISEEYNEDTFSKNEELVKYLTVDDKRWIIDLGFLREGLYNILELKLGCQLDNKKAEVEKSKLGKRKQVLLEVVDKDVKTYLGVITNQLTDKPETWNKSTVLKEFTIGGDLLIERQVFDFVSGIDGFFDWVKKEIQPEVVKKWLEVYNEYKLFVGY